MARAHSNVKVTWEQTRAFRLQRMHLVEPLGSRSLRRVAGDLGGVQAQVHSAAELQFAARLNGLPAGAVERAIYKNKTLVKTWMMRGTIHYLDAEDLPVWAAASETRMTWNKPYWQKAFGISARNVEDALGAIDGVIGSEPLTREQVADEVHRKTKNAALDELMRQGWGSILKIAAAQGLLCFGPSQGRNVTFVRPEEWLQSWKPSSADEAILQVCHRYLGSHAPATREEFARWWGFTPPQASKVLTALEDEARPVDREGDKAYVLARDLDDVLDAHEDREVRALGMFDAYTLAGLPHDQIVPKAHKASVYRTGAWVSQVLVQGGRVIGTWTHERKSKATVVEVQVFSGQKVSRRAVENALARLQPFLGEISKLTV
ncbi:MAG: winged helix DNA-binding domain-containing protein [Actinomycetota bacterium]